MLSLRCAMVYLQTYLSYPVRSVIFAGSPARSPKLWRRLVSSHLSCSHQDFPSGSHARSSRYTGGGEVTTRTRAGIEQALLAPIECDDSPPPAQRNNIPSTLRRLGTPPKALDTKNG